MSRLANLIEAHQTGRVRLFPTSRSSVVAVEESILNDLKQAKREYRLGVTMTVKGFAVGAEGDDMTRLKDMCKRQILHEVFSEFQPLIRRLERAIYELDFDAARETLRDLDNEMRW